MKLRNIARQTLQKILTGIILVSLGIHLFSLYLGQSFIANIQWIHYPLHSSMEMAGAIIAFTVAYLLINLDKRNAGTSFNMRIAAALIGMGLLDGFHAVVMAGEQFVWLHSLATFVGGLLFVLIWLPNRYFRGLNRLWPTIVGFLVTGICVSSMLFPDLIPPMISGAEFTSESTVLNVGGGVMFLVASLKLILSYQSEGRTDDLLFAVHCLLFGAAGLLFEQSRIWNVTWWGWHSLRLMAYGAALIFAVDTTLRDQRELRDRHDTLEQRVQQRTEQLERALEEKELFLEETHHRVKNNMQIISSMLSLQQSQVDDEEIRNKFQESLNRINSMAIVHELLYQSDDLAHLNFEDYTQELIAELEDTIQSGRTEITI